MRYIICIIYIANSALALNGQNIALIPEQQFKEITGLEANLQAILWENQESGLCIEDCQSVQWMDFDNDEDFDLLISSLGSSVSIFRNDNKKLQFVTTTHIASLGMPELDIMKGFEDGVNVVWHDENKDGLKDFFMFMPERMYQSAYSSNGDGTFRRSYELLAGE